ncbi:putative cytoplasmic protein, partial [Salmonella enterica subsp. enterica serovar Newport str. VA_R100512570]
VTGPETHATGRCFFLDFAINDDGERPELTNIMDEYFRQA